MGEGETLMKKIVLVSAIFVLLAGSALSTATLRSSSKTTLAQRGPVPIPTCPYDRPECNPPK